MKNDLVRASETTKHAAQYVHWTRKQEDGAETDFICEQCELYRISGILWFMAAHKPV